ncbi:hypothetical protein ABS71_03765 [bacterium SCN 62-11]|nr:MAG: hypothetical protein ABS71_03765 [bacterium SCN 62-11]
MEVVHPRCAGLDVHKASVTVCVKVGKKKTVRTFKTYAADLRQLGQWLSEERVETLVMESTGVYWKPIWNLLEVEFSDIKMVLANAEHVKQVPGRKTDVGDAEWLADLHSCGLIRGSRVPERPERETNELLRMRRKVEDERTRVVTRIQTYLESANLKLSNVVSDITGKAGMAVLRAVVAGETRAEELVKLTNTGLKAKPAEIQAALENSAGPHLRMMLRVQLALLDGLDDAISLLDAEVDQRMRPFDEVVTRLDKIPGISRRNAQEILGYAGPTLEDFPTAGHLAAWAGVCPGNTISAGKAIRRKARKGNSWLKGVLVEAAWPAIRTRSSYFRDFYHRKKATRGSQKAIMAVAHAILTTIYHMVRRGTEYQDLGANYHKLQNRERLLKRRVRELASLGYEITVRDFQSELEQIAS